MQKPMVDGQRRQPRTGRRRLSLPLIGVVVLAALSFLIYQRFGSRSGGSQSSAFSYGALAISPDGAYLAATWQDKAAMHSVRVWDYRSGSSLEELPCTLSVDRRLVHLAFSGDGSRLLVQTDTYEIEQWETAGWSTGEKIAWAVPGGDPDSARSLTLIMGKASDYYLGFDNERTFYRFRYGTEGSDATFTASEVDSVDWRTVSLSPDGGRIYYEAYVYAEPKDKYVVQSKRYCVADLAGGSCVVLPWDKGSKNMGAADCIAWSPDGAELSIDFPEERDLYFFDAATGRQLHMESFAGTDTAEDVWFGPGDLPVVVYYQEDHDDWFDRQIRLLDRSRGFERLDDFKALSDPRLVSPDGTSLLCCPLGGGGTQFTRRDLSTKADATFAWTTAEAGSP